MSDFFLDVRKALTAAVVAVDSTTPMGYPNYPLADSDKPDGLWMQLNHLPSPSDRITLGADGEDEYSGFIQMDINYPMNRGDAVPLAKMGEYRVAFPAGRPLVSNGQYVIIKGTRDGPPRIEGGYHRISIDILYYARVLRRP